MCIHQEKILKQYALLSQQSGRMQLLSSLLLKPHFCERQDETLSHQTHVVESLSLIKIWNLWLFILLKTEHSKKITLSAIAYLQGRVQHARSAQPLSSDAIQIPISHQTQYIICSLGIIKIYTKLYLGCLGWMSLNFCFTEIHTELKCKI